MNGSQGGTQHTHRAKHKKCLSRAQEKSNLSHSIQLQEIRGKKKKLKSEGENSVIILKFMLSFSGGNKKAVRTKYGTKLCSTQLL